MGNAYLISCASIMPLFSALSDIFGRGIMVTSSLGIFTFGIMLSSAADNVETLISGRILQGVGAGGIYILCLLIFTDIIPVLQWPRLYGVMCVT